MSHRYVLYVNKSYIVPNSYCPGSELCLASAHGRDDVLVQDVNSILEQGIELPPWLDATPCVVDTKYSTATRGSAAVRYLSDAENAAVEADAGEVGGSGVAEVEEEINDRDLPKVTEEDVQKMIQARKAQDESIPVGGGAMPPPMSAKSA